MNKDITPRNAKGQKHGLWEQYWPNGKLWYKGGYHNDVLIYCEDYGYLSDKLAGKIYYL